MIRRRPAGTTTVDRSFREALRADVLTLPRARPDGREIVYRDCSFTRIYVHRLLAVVLGYPFPLEYERARLLETLLPTRKETPRALGDKESVRCALQVASFIAQAYIAEDGLRELLMAMAAGLEPELSEIGDAVVSCQLVRQRDGWDPTRAAACEMASLALTAKILSDAEAVVRDCCRTLQAVGAGAGSLIAAAAPIALMTHGITGEF